MFVELLFPLTRIVRLLQELQTEQLRQGAEQARQGQEQREQRAILDQILEAVTLPAAEILTLTGDVDGVVTTGEQPMRMFESQQGSFTLAITTKAGKPAKVDGTPKWTVQPGLESAVTLTVAEDGMSGVVKGRPFGDDDPNVKSLSILVTADADLGEGVSNLEASASVELVRDQAAVLSLVEGAVEDQPAEQS